MVIAVMTAFTDIDYLSLNKLLIVNKPIFLDDLTRLID